jgi:hypothetical protein
LGNSALARIFQEVTSPGFMASELKAWQRFKSKTANLILEPRSLGPIKTSPAAATTTAFPWFPSFRFYGPNKAYFDQSWKLPQIEEVDYSIFSWLH